MYEPSHGSAPRHTGKDVVNPLATILSAAMMLRHSFGMTQEAALVENAARTVLEEGFRTRDIGKEGAVVVGTTKMGDLVTEKVRTLKVEQ
jgi:3-isopropylmalate dehydrogenase